MIVSDRSSTISAGPVVAGRYRGLDCRRSAAATMGGLQQRKNTVEKQSIRRASLFPPTIILSGTITVITAHSGYIHLIKHSSQDVFLHARHIS